MTHNADDDDDDDDDDWKYDYFQCYIIIIPVIIIILLLLIKLSNKISGTLQGVCGYLFFTSQNKSAVEIHGEVCLHHQYIICIDIQLLYTEHNSLLNFNS